MLEDGFDASRAQQQQSTLSRRHTDHPRLSSRTSDIDLALAYGSPPPSPSRSPAPANDELTPLLEKCSILLTEFHCVSHSVSHTIALLQKDPDALAAVALTLAEISNVASKMAPGALVAMKGSFPAVVALVCSPQFLIAAGVGAGVLVVGLGGYKIIKKIQEKRKEDNRMEELLELGPDLSRIEMWRRGVAEEGVVAADGDSIAGTSVEAELITPEAMAMRLGLTPEEKERLKREKKAKSRAAKSEKSEKSKKERKEKEKTKVRKAASTLQLMFK